MIWAKPPIKVDAVKKILVVCMLFVTGSAWADWVNVGESAGNNFYIDPSTIRKDGDLRKVWGIQDLSKRDLDGEMSRRYREEYDCKAARKRFLSATTHSEPMAAGSTLVSTNEASAWIEVRPNTVADDILKLVCVD